MRQCDKFAAAMVEVKLKPNDMVKLTGVRYSTVWRWRTGRSPVPAYAWTIVKDRQTIRKLTLATCK